MVRRSESNPVDRDEQLGEAIEAYLAEAEGGSPPDPEVFAARYPDLSDDLRAALEGLALVRGLVGEAEGPGHRLESGRRIAGYRIVRELGRGGMGTVYEAVHVGLDRPVALKVLGTHAAPDSTGRRRFLNEARTAAGLHHTHIVPVFDVGQVGGLCYYAMQRIEGSGLDRVLRHLRRDRQIAAGTSTGGMTPASRLRMLSPSKSKGSPTIDEDTVTWVGRSTGAPYDGPPALGRDPDAEGPPYDPPRGSAYYRWVAEVGREAAEALAHAHRHGIIHRDVKPSNLLVDARGVVWVADFGLARRLADPGLTHHDSLLGTPRYMSPEQARTGPIDGRTDVYSLGATLYELLTLRPPFEGKTAAELVEQIRDRDPASPRQTDPRIPRDLETIVLKALAKRPADRYASASELAEDLERFLHHSPVQARRIGPLGRAWRYARRHPGLTGVSTVAAATVLAVATAAYVRVVHERDQTRTALRRAEIANQTTRDALRQTEAANREARAEARERLLSWAKDARHTTKPGRRTRGLELLKDAATRGPEPAMQAKLRDAAIEFLVLRDVEERTALATGRARGLVFGPDPNHLAVLSEQGNGFNSGSNELLFSLWDIAGRKRLGRQRLNAPEQSRPTPSPGGTNAAVKAVPSAGRPGGPGSPRRPLMTAVGECALVGLPEGGLRLFDLTTGTPIHDWTLGSGGRVLSMAATPDGHRLVTVEFVPQEAPSRESLPRGDRPRGDGFRGDGPRGGEYRACLYEFGMFDQPLAILHRAVSTGSGQREGLVIAVSPDGEMVAMAARSRDTTISLWSAEDGRALGEPIEAQTELTALAIGPDGLLAAAGGGSIRFWEIDSPDSRTPLPSVTPYQGYVRHLRFNPKGTLLAAGGSGTGVELWDLASHSLVAVLPSPNVTPPAAASAGTPPAPNGVEDLAFSADGRTLAVAHSATKVSVWAIIDPLVRTQISGFDAWPTSLVFGGDNRLAMATPRGTIRVWSPGQCPSTTHPAHAEPPPGASTDRVPPNHPVALTVDRQDRLIAVDPSALKVSTGHGNTTDRSPPSPGGPGLSVLLARASESQTLFVVARGSQILAWDPDDRPEAWHPLRTPARSEPQEARSEGDRGRRGGWWRLATSPRGDRLYLIEGFQNQKVRVMDRDGDRLRPVAWSFTGPANCLALSPDGSILALGDRQGNVTLLDARDGTVRTRLARSADQTETPEISVLAFSPNGSQLAVGLQQGSVEIWSLRDPTFPLVRLPGHRGPVTALAYDREGHHLASGGGDRIVDVWDLDGVRTEFTRLGLGW